MNDAKKIQIVRHYTTLHDRLSYVQLQEDNWKCYYEIGLSENIWKGCIGKQQTEKFSICYTYGHSKSIVEQHIQQFEKHIEEAYVAIHEFELEILSKAIQYDVFFSALKNLSLAIHQFDITDHRLLQKFFGLQFDKSQVRIDLVIYMNVLDNFGKMYMDSHKTTNST